MMRSKLLTWSVRSLLILVLFASAVGAILSDVHQVFAANDRYWIGNAGNWTDTAHWSTSDGGAGGASVPGSTNDVHFTNASFTLSGQKVSLNTGTINCAVLDTTGSGADSPIFRHSYGNNVTWNIYGNVTIESGWTMTNETGYNYSVTWNFAGTLALSTATSTVDFFENIVTAGAGTVTMSTNWYCKSFTRTSGTFALNGFTLYCDDFFAGNGGTFTDTVVLTGERYDQSFNLTGANTFTNLTVDTDSKHDEVSIAANQVVSGTFTAQGTSHTNRAFIKSNTTSQRTITAATVVSQYADYYYIIGAGAGDWDLSSAGEDSVDFNGNSGITFTYPWTPSQSRYWTGLDDGIGGAGSWVQPYDWSTTSGGTAGAGRYPPPTSSSNAYFDSNSGFTVGNTDVGYCFDQYEANVVKDLDTTGADVSGAAPVFKTDAWTSYTQYLNIYGSLTLCSGTVLGYEAAYYNDVVKFRGSGTISAPGTTFAHARVVLASTGTYTLNSALYCSYNRGTDPVYEYSSGTLDTNGYTIYIGGAGYFSGGGKTYYGLYSAIAGTVTINGANNITNLTRIGTATYTDALKFGADQYITNLTLTGYSGVYRLQFGSTVAGTSRQCSVSGTVNVTNTDLSDSAKVGAGDPDISAGNNSDFGGNLGWIFDTGYYIYWVGNTGNWSDLTNHWSSTSGGSPGTGRVPLVQDIAVFDANSFTIPGRTVTIDITNISGIDSSAVTNTPTITKSGTIDIYGDCNFGVWTYTVTTTNFKGLDTTLESDSTLTTNLYILKNEGFMSSLVLVGNVTVSGTVYPQSGVFNHNGFNLTATYYDSATTTYNRQILLGSGIMTLNGTGAVTKLNMNATKLTLTAGESTIIFTNSGASGQTFAPASLTYNNITIAGAGAYTLTINSVFTCGTLTIDRSQANKTISGNYAVTIGDSGGLVLALSSTRTITITNTDFTMASGVVFGDYLVISGSAAGGGGTFFANVGGHSTDSGGNSGWIWTPPTAPTIQTNNASDVTYLGERLNGQLLTAGSYVIFYCYFEYGPTVAYGFTTPETTLTGAGSFSQYLSPYKVYHYRAVVRFGLNDHAYGNDKTVSISGAVGQAKAAVSDPGQSAGTALVGAGDVPAQPARMYAEGNTAGIPIAPAINDALAETNTPEAAFWYPIAFLAALLLGFGAFGMTRSLLVQAIVSACVMAAFAGGGTLGDGLLPYWTVIVFLIEGVLIWLIQEKQNI